MSWKNLSYWLKGGIISLALFLILLILSFISQSSDMGNIFQWVILVLGLPAYILAGFIPLGFGPFSSFFILIIPYSFAIGVFIGWIVGKIKPKKVE